MANQYQDYGVPPPRQDDYGQNSYGNSDYQSGGGGGGYNRGGNYGGGNRGGFKGSSDVVTQDDTIFVSGMDPDVTENEINDHFGSIGIIKKDRRTQKPKIWIYRNKETGAGKGEATITYDDSSAASSAIDWFDGKDFNGNKIKVSLAQRNNSWQQKGGGGGGKPRGGFGGGNRGNFGGNDDRPPRNNDDRGPRGGGGGGSGGGGQAREGDWTCSGCQNKNFAWRNECNRCKEPKGGDDGGSGRPPPRSGGFQNRDNRSGGGGGFGRGGGGGDRGGFRGGPMRSGPGGHDRGGNRQRPY